MIVHLMFAATIGLVASIAAAFAGYGVLGIIATYSAIGTVGLFGSATIAVMRSPVDID